eukprot:CAMPEP_0196785074 /NCGR_PEP_ID=MMETSP1104-20130614/18562_1 /TAXON_ID=33652 /ORGANISM="Cafeteria sp., Strain Caron Lab Isolate" /LENGTH=54 /DNA_ID=CAMNT_0042155371 /DNA_START=441 /DNA_END=605 /DNA_ORIENTATION=-
MHVNLLEFVTCTPYQAPETPARACKCLQTCRVCTARGSKWADAPGHRGSVQQET